MEIIIIKRYFDDYLDYCTYRKRLSPKTIIAYRIDLKQFFAYIDSDGTGNGGAASAKELLKSYLSFLSETYKCASIKRKLASIRAYYNYLEDENIIAFNPVHALRAKFREEQRLPKTMLFHTVQRLLDFVYKKYSDAPRPESLRDILVIEFLFATGVRVSELCSLKEEDVDVTTGKINIFGKGSKERIVQICNPEVLAKLSEYRRVFDVDIKSSGYFFINRLHRRFSEQSVRGMICNYTRKAGITQHITPKMFRHTFATLLLEEEVDIRYIQRMLGHASVKTTEIYTYVVSSKENEILMLKHPRNKINLV
jgi:integrase/recombinase XerD